MHLICGIVHMHLICTCSFTHFRYDHMSWYPLGRPVGTTIYPGMQITSVRYYTCTHNNGAKAALWALEIEHMHFACTNKLFMHRGIV